jgi:hypothetical protein
MRVRTKINSFFNFLAAVLLTVFRKTTDKHTSKDLRRMEFKTSTQRMGVRYGERIRDVFRFKWIRKKDYFV